MSHGPTPRTPCFHHQDPWLASKNPPKARLRRSARRSRNKGLTWRVRIGSVRWKPFRCGQQKPKRWECMRLQYQEIDQKTPLMDHRKDPCLQLEQIEARSFVLVDSDRILGTSMPTSVIGIKKIQQSVFLGTPSYAIPHKGFEDWFIKTSKHVLKTVAFGSASNDAYKCVKDVARACCHPKLTFIKPRIEWIQKTTPKDQNKFSINNQMFIYSVWVLKTSLPKHQNQRFWLTTWGSMSFLGAREESNFSNFVLLRETWLVRFGMWKVISSVYVRFCSPILLESSISRLFPTQNSKTAGCGTVSKAHPWPDPK